MYDNGSANDLIHPEPARQHLTVRPPAIAEQGREVACVAGVFCGCRIIMGTRIGKPSAPAIAALVDVKREKAGICIGQTQNIRDHQRPAAPLEETDRPPKPRMRLSAVNTGNGRRRVAVQMNHLLTMLCRFRPRGESKPRPCASRKLSVGRAWKRNRLGPASDCAT